VDEDGRRRRSRRRAGRACRHGLRSSGPDRRDRHRA